MEGVSFTLIIPSYHAEKYLSRCLESVISQTSSTELEIYVVDSSARPLSNEWEERFPRVRFIRSPKPLFAGEARNLGAQVGRGTYLFFLDADCLWSEKYFESAKREILQHSSELILTGPLLFEGMFDARTRAFHSFEFNEFLKSKSSPSRFALSSNLILSRRLFERVGGFTPELPRCQDLEFSSRCRSKGVNEILYVKDLVVTHQSYEALDFALLRKAFLHGRTRRSVDVSLIPEWQFCSRWWHRGFAKWLNMLCFGRITSRLLMSAYPRRYLLMDLFRLMKFATAWARGFAYEEIKKAVSF